MVGVPVGVDVIVLEPVCVGVTVGVWLGESDTVDVAE